MQGNGPQAKFLREGSSISGMVLALIGWRGRTFTFSSVFLSKELAGALAAKANIWIDHRTFSRALSGCSNIIAECGWNEHSHCIATSM